MLQPADSAKLVAAVPRARDQIRYSMLMRLSVIPVTGLATLLTARVVVSGIGVPGYGVAALVATLPALMPSADLGVGAAVTTAVAAGGSRDEVLRVVLSSIRVLLAMAGFIVIMAIGLAATSSWGLLLGLASSPATNWAIGVSVAVFGLSLPLAIGARVLLGGGQNHISVLVYGLSAPIVLAICLVGRAAGAGLWLYAAAPAFASLATGFVGCVQASRRTGVDLVDAFRRSLQRRVKGGRIRNVAGPMAVISACLPIAYQSDRLILSHATNVTQLAIYSAGAALFAPVLSVLASGGQSLWPIFTRARLTSPSTLRRPFLVGMATFTAVGLGLAAVLVALGPVVGTWMLRSHATVPISLMASFGLLIVVHASYYPSGMLLTDPTGLRLQAKTSVAMLVLNVPLSYLLAKRIGAAGPALGSAIAIAVCMWLPGVLEAIHRLRVPARQLVTA
jgi:O-antigen/teichoic acid export membrane protein